MENTIVKNPNDSQIVNKDDSITNKEANNNPSEGKQSTGQDKKNEHDLTMLSDNDSKGVLADESTSNKGQGPAGENL